MAEPGANQHVPTIPQQFNLEKERIFQAPLKFTIMNHHFINAMNSIINH